MRKFYSPRWLHQEVTINATTTLTLPASQFPNDEIYDWHLQWLSIVGAATADGAGFYTNALGGVARRLRLNVGISQMGDINLVPSSGQCMFGPHDTYLVHSNVLNAGMHLRFDPRFPYQLPPNTGLLATVQNFGGASNIDNLGLLATGYELPEGEGGPRNPVHFGGHAGVELEPGGQYTLDNADLYNDGEHPATLTSLILNGFLINEDGTTYDTLDRVYWQINPSSGPLWMPNPGRIPVGNIAPFNRSLFDPSDVGPRAYVFAGDTIMKPHQRLAIEVENQSASAQTFHLCLFGYLEVS